MKTVELVGIPGSGKSALAARLGEQGFLLPERALVLALRRRGPTGMERLDENETLARADDLFRACDLSLSFSRFWANHPDFVAAVSAITDSISSGPDEKAYVLSILFAHCRLAEKIRADCPEPGPLVWDEGFVQRAMTLCLPSRGDAASPDLVRAYAQSLPRPDRIALLRLDPAAALERLQSRDQGPPRRMRSMDHAQRLAFLRRAQDILEQVALGLPGVDVVELDASQPLEAVVQAALEGLTATAEVLP